MCYNRAYGYGPGFRSGQGFGPWGHKFGNYFRRVPVNIQEENDRFELSLYAPALVKERIRLSVKDDVLTVSYQPEEQKEEPRFTRREYHNESFERSFVLNNKVSTEGITAAYADGILKVTLPKNPDRNQPAQDISIS